MRSGLAKAALVVTFVTLASRVVGFGRWLAQGHFVGNGDFTDAFNAANLLPNVLFEVAAGGALAGAVVPLVSGPLSRAVPAHGAGTGEKAAPPASEDAAANRERASRSASAMLGWTLLVLVPAGVLMALLSEPLAAALDLGDDGLTAVAAAFLRVFAVQVPVYGVAVVLGGILQAHKRFFWPAFSPLLSSLVVIGAYWGFAARTGAPRGEQDVAELSAAALDWLAWGITAGVVALAVPLVVPAIRTGLRLRLTLAFPDGEGRRAAHLASAGVGALVAQQLALVVAMKAGTGLGVYTTWLYAYNVYLLPYAVLAYPIATSAFPHFSEHAAAGRRDELNALVASTTRTLLVVAGAGAAALIAAAPAVGSVFDVVVAGDAPGMDAALTWMAPGLLGYALVLHLSRVLYATGHGRTAVVATAAGWAVMAFGLLVVWGWFTAGPPSGTQDPAADDVLAALGAAGSLGMTVAGAGLALGVARHLGRAAFTRLGRTAAALVVGITAGAFAGHMTEYLLRPEAMRIDPNFVAHTAGERDFGTADFLCTLGTGLLAGLVAAAVVVAVAVLAGSIRRGLPSSR